MHMAIKKRGKIYQLVQRVPRRYQPVEARETVWISLHTDSETAAKVKAPLAWAQMIEAWEARLAGDSQDAESRFEAAKELAAMGTFATCPPPEWRSCLGKNCCSALKPSRLRAMHL